MATSTIDAGFLDQPGAVRKSAAQGGGVDGFKELVVERAKTEIESLMSGAGIVMDGPQGVAAEHDIADIRTIARTAAETLVFSGNETFKLFNKATPFLYAADLDLPSDGVTDCTAALNAAFAAGPVTVLLDVPAGVRIDGKVRLRSGCSLGMGAGTVARMGAAGRIVAEGYFAEDYTSAPLRLLEDADAGADTALVDTTPQGGGDLEDVLADGDRITFRDGDNLHEAVVVDASDPEELIWEPACPFALSAATAQITRQKVLPLSGDIAGNTSIIPVEPGALGEIALGDYVLVMDDATADGAALTSVEPAQVVGIETDGLATISLDRPIRRAMTTAASARVQVLAPVVGARVSGVKAEFLEAPDARVDTFEILYGVDCVFENLRILNENLFGSRGQMYRVSRSYRSGYRDCIGLRPRFTDPGEGVGWSCLESVQCFAERMAFDACRHSIAFQASTDCWAELIQSARPVYAHVDFAGRLESGCWARGLWTSGGRNMAAFGDASRTAGCEDCYVTEAVSLDPSEAHVDIVAPASRCGVRQFIFKGGTEALKAYDHPLDGALLVPDCYLADGKVYGTSGYPISIDGGFTDSGARAVVRPRISNVELIGHDRHFRLFRCVSPIIDECEVNSPAVVLADEWVVRAQDAAGLIVRRSDFMGVKNGFNLTNCSNGRIYRNSYVDWTGTAEYSDGGGNTGLLGADNISVGFTKTALLPS